MRYRVTWADGLTLEVTVRRFPWWLVWWPSRNVTFGQTVFEGGPVGLNDPTARHEFTHARDWKEKGTWWMLMHPGERERRAKAAEAGPWPQWDVL